MQIFEQIYNDFQLDIAQKEVDSTRRLINEALSEANKTHTFMEYYIKGLEDYQNSLPQNTVVKLKSATNEGERALFRAYLENFKLLDQMRTYCSSYRAKIDAYQKRMEDAYKLVREHTGEQRKKAIDDLWALMQSTPLELTMLQAEAIAYLKDPHNKNNERKKGII